jgi:hypothetical protein
MKETKLQRINELIKHYSKVQREYDLSIAGIKSEVNKIGVSWTTFHFLLIRHKFFQRDRGY